MERSGHRVKMPIVRRLCYAVGHILNDLTASMWFSYLLIYLHRVISFDNRLAGGLMLLGQIVDALSTPFVGYESDRSKGIRKIGKRKTWHLIGTVCVLGTIAFVFNKCISCANSPDWAQFIYYAPFIAIFQFGWASVQISHLSLIPELTRDEHERVELNGLRFACTVLSNLAVYGIFLLIFFTQHVHGDTSTLTEKDAPRFQLLVFIVMGIGLFFVIIFHVGTREKPQDEIDQNGSVNTVSDGSIIDTIEKSSEKVKMSWKCWLKEHQFYQVAGIYMCTRLVVNVSQIYLPMYLLESLSLDKTSIAIVPLVVYVGGFVTSLFMRFVNRKLGRKLTFVIGDIIALGACVWLFFIQPSGAKTVYGAAALLGIGGSTMLVTSLAMTADLIAENVESGAFVYGAMSFLDKLSNGLAVMLVQQFHPCVKHSINSPSGGCCPACVWYYRDVMSFLPGAAAVVALIILFTLLPQKIGTRRKGAQQRMKTIYSRQREVQPSEGGRKALLENDNTRSYGCIDSHGTH